MPGCPSDSASVSFAASRLKITLIMDRMIRQHAHRQRLRVLEICRRNGYVADVLVQRHKT